MYGLDFILQVDINIKPNWIVPPSSNLEKIVREQAEVRMKSFGDRLALYIRDILSAKSPEEWATANNNLNRLLSERT